MFVLRRLLGRYMDKAEEDHDDTDDHPAFREMLREQARRHVGDQGLLREREMRKLELEEIVKKHKGDKKSGPWVQDLIKQRRDEYARIQEHDRKAAQQEEDKDKEPAEDDTGDIDPEKMMKQGEDLVRKEMQPDRKKRKEPAGDENGSDEAARINPMVERLLGKRRRLHHGVHLSERDIKLAEAEAKQRDGEEEQHKFDAQQHEVFRQKRDKLLESRKSHLEDQIAPDGGAIGIDGGMKAREKAMRDAAKEANAQAGGIEELRLGMAGDRTADYNRLHNALLPHHRRDQHRTR